LGELRRLPCHRSRYGIDSDNEDDRRPTTSTASTSIASPALEVAHILSGFEEAVDGNLEVGDGLPSVKF
jgi:hypothetical protein